MKSQLVRRDVFLEIDRLVLRRAGKLAQTLPHFFGIKVQSLRDQIGVSGEIAGGIAQQQSGERRIVVDDDAALAVENLAAGRENRNFASLVLLRQRRVELALHHLQPPQPIGQHQKNDEDDVLHRSQAGTRYFFVAAKHGISRRSSVVGRQPQTSKANLQRRYILSGEVNLIVTPPAGSQYCALSDGRAPTSDRWHETIGFG